MGNLIYHSLPFILAIIITLYTMYLFFTRGIIVNVVGLLMLAFNLTIWGAWFLPNVPNSPLTICTVLVFTASTILIFVIAKYFIDGTKKIQQ
ncbi:MAG: hypothetical protein WA057_04780 [Candidatus Magasanikiibacteriota bacterium]